MIFDLCTIDWTAISAIVSSIVIILTIFSLCQNKKQLKEMKRQWEESNRPRIVFSIISHRDWFFIKIANVGNNTAYDISVDIESNFVNSLPFSLTQSVIRDLNKPFILEAGQRKYYNLVPIYSKNSMFTYADESLDSSYINDWLDNNINRKFNVYGTYCNSYCSRDHSYYFNDNVSINEFINQAAILKDDLTESVEQIKDHLIVHNTQYYPIQKSLHNIAMKLENLKFRNLDGD